LFAARRRQHLNRCSTSSMRSSDGTSCRRIASILEKVENVVDDRQQRICGTVNGFGETPRRRIDAGVAQQVRS